MAEVILWFSSLAHKRLCDLCLVRWNTLGALSHCVRNLTTLRLPWCKKAQDTWKGREQALQPTVLAEPSLPLSWSMYQTCEWKSLQMILAPNRSSLFSQGSRHRKVEISHPCYVLSKFLTHKTYECYQMAVVLCH